MTTEQEARLLPPHLQQRMAHLVLRGWKIEKMDRGMVFGKGSWVASLAEGYFIERYKIAMGLRLFSAASLHQIIDQMEGVVEEMQAIEQALSENRDLPDAPKFVLARGPLETFADDADDLPPQ